MKQTHLLPVLVFALVSAVAGCASAPSVVHTTEFYDIVLSPRNRTSTQEDLTLVSISRTGRVTIRDSRGVIWHARSGENLANKFGGFSNAVKSVNRQTGTVVLEGERRVYY